PVSPRCGISIDPTIVQQQPDVTVEQIAKMKDALRQQIAALEEAEKNLGPKTAEEIDARVKQLNDELAQLQARKKALKYTRRCPSRLRGASPLDSMRRLRTSPRFALKRLEELSPEQRKPFEELTRDASFYGLLIPRPPAAATIKAVDSETAALLTA